MVEQRDSQDLITHLRHVLLRLNASPYPEILGSAHVEKRASVALILRIQPNYSHWPAFSETALPFPSHPLKQRRRSSVVPNPSPNFNFEAILNTFFEQDWVKHGDPEILFIKRAPRVGDKWNGHVALPGGKRDPEDDDDAVTAAREALEEVGIDLSYTNAIAIGNLPQRVVTTSWGKVPLMVLCPYIYLLTSPTYPSQRLQPTEVASSHWVPLRALLSPSLRTYEYADVSARLAQSELNIKRWFLQAMLSKMMFGAIRLVPTNSTYCAFVPNFMYQDGPLVTGFFRNVKKALMGPEARYEDKAPPLLLWGLTLGVVSDFLEHLPPHNALELWTYPTFTNWDVRFVMWALSYRFRKKKAAEMSTIAVLPDPLQDSDNPAMHNSEEKIEKKTGYTGEERQDETSSSWDQTGRAKMIARGAAVNSMLQGYYPIVRQSVAVALTARVGFAVLIAFITWKRIDKRK